MEILKQLLSKTFNNTLSRLEKRTTQQIKDLQFTGISFIKQGKVLEKIVLIKKESKSIVRKPIINEKNDKKRNISADVLSNRNEIRNRDRGNPDKQIRSNTPDYLHRRNRSRNKTASANIDQKATSKDYKIKIASTTLTHLKIKSSNNKMPQKPSRHKTPEKVLQVITKKEILKKEKEKRVKNVSSSNENSQINGLDKTLSNLNTSKNMNIHSSPNQLTTEKEQINNIVKLTNIDLDSLHIGGNIKRPESPKPESPKAELVKCETIFPDSPNQTTLKVDSPRFGSLTPILRKPIFPKVESISPKIETPKIDTSISSPFTFNFKQMIKDKNNPFSFNIIQFLNVQEQMNLFITTRHFDHHMLTLINTIRNDIKVKHEFQSKNSINDQINALKAKHSSDQLNYSIPPFQMTRAAFKAVELLNDKLYDRVFHQTKLASPLNQIILIYRMFFQLLNIKEIWSIKDDNEFWIKAATYILNNNNGQTGTFFSQSGSQFDFSSQNIIKIQNMLHGKEETIKPVFYSNICGTTGLVVFLIKDVLEYCGVLSNDKRTVPAIVYHRLLYMKDIEERVEGYINYLQRIKDD